MRLTRELPRWRWLAIIAIFAMVAAACGSGSDEETTPEETAATTAATSATTEGTTATTTGATEATEGTEPPAPTGFTYKLAIFSDPTTDNAWAYYDTESDVWNQYVLAPSVPSLYTLSFPNYTLVPSIASDIEPPIGAAEGDNWVIDVNIQEGLTWSDGSPMTANDVAFTVGTVQSLGLGGNFLAAYPLAAEDDPDTEDDESAEGIISVEALSDTMVRFTWSSQPGLAQWQFGAAQGPIFSQAFWGTHVDAAGEAGDLYAVSGAGAPSGGPMVYDSREPGAFARTVANANDPDTGSVNRAYDTGGYEYEGGQSYTVGDTSGNVVAEWTAGPNASESIYSVYETQDAAVLALRDGEVDFLLNPLGLQRGLQATVLEAGDLDVITNASNGFRYLAFNTRSFPGSDLAFRQAIACMIDKEFMANNVLQGVAIPLNSLVPPGNAFWANPTIGAYCDGQTQEERVNSSIAILEEGGWTWSTKPEWNADNRDVIPKGEGLRGPGGQSLSELELLAPGPGYDPLRATYSLFIEDWANDLGIPVSAEPTGFSVIVDRVFGPTDWDMYILGWGVTTYPDYVVDFFVSSADSAAGGFNTPGYSNPDYDELGDQLKAETDVNAAAALVREMDAIIAQDVPYVVLFTTPVLETYRNTLDFPATTTLDGLQNFTALTGVVNVTQ